jgi:hypothetical protein
MSKFLLGQIVATPGALELFDKDRLRIAEFIVRHVNGDWGNVDKEDARENDLAIEDELRILSSYKFNDTEFWIITEADRSVTTVLLPDEY